MKKLITLFQYLIFIIFLIIFLFSKNKWLIIFTIIPLILVYFIAKKLKVKHFGLLLFITAFLIRIVISIWLKVPIEDDFKTMYDASLKLLKGDMSFVTSGYFMSFSYQMGHTFYQAILLKLCSSVLFLKIINSLITSTITLLIYLIAKRFSKESSARIVSLLYLIYLYPLYLNTVLTNQHLPALIILLMIYLVTSEKFKNLKKYLNVIIIGLLLVIANVLRSESIVYLFSFILLGFLFINKTNYKETFKRLIILLLVYFISFTAISGLFKVTGLTSNGLKNEGGLWKFYVGLNYKENGMYNELDQNIFFVANKEEQSQLLVNRIKDNNIKTIVLFLKKEVILWTQSNFNITILNKNINTNLYKLALNYNQGLVYLVFILFLIGIFPKKKTTSNKFILLLEIILFVYFGVYLLIEVSPRYSYILHMLIFIVAAIGLDRLEGYFKNKSRLQFYNK